MDIISYALSKKGMQQSVSDYLDEHLTNPTNPPLDTSLEIAGAAADSKATGDKLSALKEDLDNQIKLTLQEDFTGAVVDISSLSRLTRIVHDSNGNWSTSATSHYSKSVDVSNISIIKITANANYAAHVAFLKSMAGYGEAGPADFATGETGNHVLQPGYTETFIVPNDATTMSVWVTYQNNDVSPVVIESLVSRMDAIGMIANRLDSMTKKSTNIRSGYKTLSYIALNIAIGDEVNIEPVANNSAAYIIRPCKAGDVFVLYGSGGSAFRLWGFTDDEYHLLSVAASNSNAPESDPLKLTATSDGYFISNVLINSSLGYGLTLVEVSGLATEDYVNAQIKANTSIYGEPKGISWEVGGIASTGAGQISLNYMVRLIKPYKIPGDGTIQAANGYLLRVFWYSELSPKYSSTNLVRKTAFTSDPIVLEKDDIVGIVIKDAVNTVQEDTSITANIEWNIYSSNIIDVVQDMIHPSSPFYHGKLDIRRADVHQYYRGLNPDYSTYPYFSDTKYSYIIGLYDALLAEFPDYITKVDRGLASGLDDNGDPYHLYEYVFSSREIKNTRNERIRPVILVDANAHGFEKNGSIGLYLFLEDVCKRWTQNDTLKALRWHVDFRVVPVTNPYGFDHNTYVNGNGVNINRNFPCEGWEKVTTPPSQVNGEEPLDQPESQVIADIINENPSALMYLCIHTNGEGYVDSYSHANDIQMNPEINDDYYRRIYPVIDNHIEEQTALIANDYGLSISKAQHIGFIMSPMANKLGQTDRYCLEYLGNIFGIIFEVFNGIKIGDNVIITNRGPESKKMCSEMIGNFIAQMLYEFADE